VRVVVDEGHPVEFAAPFEAARHAAEPAQRGGNGVEGNAELEREGRGPVAFVAACTANGTTSSPRVTVGQQGEPLGVVVATRVDDAVVGAGITP
jgi:hypothetical protein